MNSTRLYWHLITPWSSRTELLARLAPRTTLTDGTNKTYPYVEVIRPDGSALTNDELIVMMLDLTRPGAGDYAPQGCGVVFTPEFAEYTLDAFGRSAERLSECGKLLISIVSNGVQLACITWSSQLYKYIFKTNDALNPVLRLNRKALKESTLLIDSNLIAKLLLTVYRETDMVLRVRVDNRVKYRRPISDDTLQERDMEFDRWDAQVKWYDSQEGQEYIRQQTVDTYEEANRYLDDTEYIKPDIESTVSFDPVVQPDYDIMAYYMQGAELDNPRASFLHYYNCLEYFITKGRKPVIRAIWKSLYASNKRDPWNADFEEYYKAFQESQSEQAQLIRQLQFKLPNLKEKCTRFLKEPSAADLTSIPPAPLQSIGITAALTSDAEDLPRLIIERIYAFRNALVHSKSDEKRLVPFETDQALKSEVLLVKFISTLILEI